MYRRYALLTLEGDCVSSRGHRDGVARNLILGIIVIMKLFRFIDVSKNTGAIYGVRSFGEPFLNILMMCKGE